MCWAPGKVSWRRGMDAENGQRKSGSKGVNGNLRGACWTQRSSEAAHQHLWAGGATQRTRSWAWGEGSQVDSAGDGSVQVLRTGPVNQQRATKGTRGADSQGTGNAVGRASPPDSTGLAAASIQQALTWRPSQMWDPHHQEHAGRVPEQSARQRKVPCR